MFSEVAIGRLIECLIRKTQHKHFNMEVFYVCPFHILVIYKWMFYIYLLYICFIYNIYMYLWMHIHVFFYSSIYVCNTCIWYTSKCLKKRANFSLFKKKQPVFFPQPPQKPVPVEKQRVRHQCQCPKKPAKWAPSPGICFTPDLKTNECPLEMRLLF